MFGKQYRLIIVLVYLVEISPPAGELTVIAVLRLTFLRVRGKTTCMLQTLITIGIVIGYFTCYATVSLPSSFSWRIPFMLQALTCFILASGTPFIPYSPRWLLHAGREEEAWEVIAMFDCEGGERQKEKILERISKEAAAERGTNDEFVVPRRGNNILDRLASGQHIRPVVQSFKKDNWGRTVFAMTVRYDTGMNRDVPDTLCLDVGSPAIFRNQRRPLLCPRALYSSRCGISILSFPTH